MENLETADLEKQLRRLLALATHNLRVARTFKRRAFVEGQINALRAVAVSYALELGTKG